MLIFTCPGGILNLNDKCAFIWLWCLTVGAEFFASMSKSTEPPVFCLDQEIFLQF